MLCVSQASSGAPAGKGFTLGVEVFLEGYTKLVRGKRVALLTNQSGLDSKGRSTIDLLHQSRDVNLVKLFSPEHGIRGKEKAGVHVDDTVDRKTGLPVTSLYGKHGYRPKPQHLQGVDVLIYDIQDVGSRAYTYIWSLGEAMTTCGELGIEVIVLDRPCVYGGTVIDGPICDTRIKSLLSRFPIPRVYGMTCGEMARLFNAEHDLGCTLTIIPMANYHRGMRFESTGLRWKPPSPNIPDLNSARCFPATGTIGTLSKVHIGIGTNLPFQIIGAPWLDANHMLSTFNSYKLPGVKFGAQSFPSPKGAFFPGKTVNALTIQVTKPEVFNPARLEILFVMYLLENHRADMNVSQKSWKTFDRFMGTSTVRSRIEAGKPYETVVGAWGTGQQRFAAKRAKYLLYKHLK
jgi:beta-N-acetylhexosaminidase